MHVRISEIANSLDRLIQGGNLALGEEVEDLLELVRTLVLHPGGILDLTEVVVQVEDTTLTLTGLSRGTWQVPAMPGFAISGVAVTVTLAVDANTGAVKATSSLRGAVTTAAGTWKMTAVSAEDVWRVSVELGAIAVADVIALVPGFDAEGLVPGPLWSVATGVKLSRFELLFDPHEASRTSVSLAVAVPGSWELLPGKLALRETTLVVRIVLDTQMELQVDGVAAGTTELGGHAYQVEIGLGSARGFTLAIAAREADPPLRLADVAAILGGGEAIAPFEETLQALGFRGLRLNRLAFGLDLRSMTVLHAAFDVALVLRDISLQGSLEYPDLRLSAGLAAGSALDVKQVLERFAVPVQDLPALAVTKLRVTLEPGVKAASVRASLAGAWTLQVGNAALRLDKVDLGLDVRAGAVRAECTAWARVGGAAGSVTIALPAMTVTAGLLPGASLEVRELVQAMMPAEVAVPAAAPAIVVREFALAAQPRDGTFSLAASTADMWTLPFGQGLALGKLKLALAAAKEGEQIARSGSLAGTLGLGGGELTGTLKLEQGGGSLSLAQGEAPIGLTDVIAGFVPGGVALPAEIGGLERLQLRGLSGSVDVATKRYQFKGAASLEGLTLGALSVPRASGSLEIAGTGSVLERLSISFDASVRQELVPALQVDAIAFALELRRAEGGGWTWHVGGSLVAGLFELPKQTLRADASNGELRFSIASGPPLSWSLPGAPEVLGLSFTGLALTLRRDEATKQTAWSFEGTGGLQLAGLPRVSGTLGLYYEQERRGFTFTAAADQGALELKLPLVAGDPRMTLGCRFKAEKLSLLKTSEWTLSAESSLTWVVPRASAPDSADPVDKALVLLGKMFADRTTVTLAATTSGVVLTVAALPQVPVPVPVFVGQELVWDRMGSIGLTRLELRLGATVSASGKIRVGLPEELSNIFGQENGKPKTRVFTPEWVLGLSVDEKAGLSLQIASLPLNLEASNYFKKETEGERTWSRFTLGDVFSCRYGSFEDEPGQTWVHVDLFDMGAVRFQQPSFGFNGADFAANVHVDVLRALRVPTAPLRWLLTRGGMKDLAGKLPTHVALLDVHVLDPATKTFDAARFVSTLQELAAAMRIELAGADALRAIADAMAGRFNQLPQELRSYLDVTLPRRLDLSLAVTPAAGLGVKFDIRAPKEPLRCLVPTPAGVCGLTIRKLSLGEVLGGNLLLLAADLDYDFFDLPALVASLALPAAVSAQLTDTTSIHRKFIVKDLMCLVVYQTAVPIPIPIWFDQLGFKHHGLEGVRSQLVLGNNLAGLAMGTLLKGLSDLYKELQRFFTDAGYSLPADLFARSGINLGVHVKPGFVQLPKYLGGALLGSEQELFNLGVDQLLVPVVNFLKAPDIGKLLGVVPLQLRQGSFGAQAPLRIGPFEPQAAWLVSTLREFDGLVASRGAQRNGFIDSLYSGGAAAGDASVQLLREAVSAATGGEGHEGVVAFARGSLNVPNVRCSVQVFAGMLATRSRGLLTQFRLKGDVGSLLALDLGGRVAVTARPARANQPATAELSAAGDLELRVLGHAVLGAGFALQDGELAFAGGLSLFPPDWAFKVKGDVSGRIGRDRLNLDGAVEIGLAPLPAVGARLSLSYEHVELNVAWLGGDWTLRMARRFADQVAFSGRANRPVTALPELVTLHDAKDDAKGPSFELVGPRDASLALSGKVSIPALGMRGGGSLSLAPGRVEAAVSGKLHGLSTALALRGEALDRPASFTFAAEFTEDVFAQITDLLHAGFKQVMDGARKLADEAERVFNAAWADFRGLVERGANAIRAGILETKAKIEQLIDGIQAAADKVIAAIGVKDEEIAARKQFLDAIRQGAVRDLHWFQDRVAGLRKDLEAKRKELSDHDAWYSGLGSFDKFMNWAHYAARRLDLVIAAEVLPGVLAYAEQELAKARDNVPLIVDQADGMLQQLDLMRNRFAGELSRHKQAIVDRRRELDHYNEMLMLDADALIRKFGQAVDDTVMKASKETFQFARARFDDLEAAGAAFLRQGGRPFEIRRLAVKGSLGAHSGNTFEAHADIVLNTCEPRRVAQDLGIRLDFDDLPRTAAELAKDLWDRRDSLRTVEYDEYERARIAKLEQEYAAVADQRARLGREFGETLDKKLLLDMKWTELAEFHHYLQKQEVRSGVLGDAAALTAVFRGVLERYREAAEAGRLSRHVRALVQQAHPDTLFDVIDPAANLEHMMGLLLEMLQSVLKAAGTHVDADMSFATDGAPAPVFRLANLASVRWDEVAGNEQRLIAEEDAALSFDAEAQPKQPQFRLPGAVLFAEPDFAGESMFVIHVGESNSLYRKIHSLAVLPGHRVRLYEEGAPEGAHRTVTGCVTLPGPVMARAEVDRVDLAAELPPPQLGSWAALTTEANAGLWRRGRGVRYAIAFEYGDGRLLRSGWWSAVGQWGMDAEGYVEVDAFACPMLSGISRDPTGKAVARRVYRQIRGEPEVQVARIDNNVDTTWTEPVYPLVKPPAPALKSWAATSPVAGSPVWRPGFGVRYAVEFEYADGAVARSGWWTAERQVHGDGYSYHDYAFPTMTLPVDPIGQIVARRVVRQFAGLPERVVARIANNTVGEWTDRDLGTRERPTPTPVFQGFLVSLPVEGSPVWQPGFGVRYAVEFEYVDGMVVRSDWWQAERQIAGDGYSFHDYALAQMTLPIDPTGQAVARRVIRQFKGRPERMLARITNNTDVAWTDHDRGSADVPPKPPALMFWVANLPVAGSPVWRSGFGVRYALEFEYADGSVVRSPWWESQTQDAEGYSFHWYAFPRMTLPRDPTGEAVARRMIRQFIGLPERLMARITNNTDTEWTDTDRGIADKPLPPPTVNLWSASLPVAGSPVWQPGVGVRYAVEFEYTDGFVARTGWWRAGPQDGDGYFTPAYAMPQLTIPCDPGGMVAARRIVRQFTGMPARVVARIANNTDTEWTDTDRGTADHVPPPPTVNTWSAHLPVEGSPAWRPGFQVRYALEFEYADGTLVRGGWWRTAAPQDVEGYATADGAMPVLNVPADPSGQVVARRVIRQFVGRPERLVARLTDNGVTSWRDTDSGAADMPPPPPPTGNCWSRNLPVAGSPAWRPGFRVRYAVAFEYADGTVTRSGWWRTAEPQDGEGYVTSDYAMPVLNIPADPSGQVVARRMIRQFVGRPERVVGRITNNVDPTWCDADGGAVDMPPPAPTGNGWSRNLPVAGSAAWQPGFRVRYAVAFEYADGAVVRSDWWRTAEPQDGEGYVTSDYALPVLNIPVDPSGQSVARRIVRQFAGRPEREVARIANNTDPTWSDTDVGFADVPPGPGLNCWAANLPVVGSPLWQPGFAVRYAIVYEFADGTAGRSAWRDEHDGYLSSDGYARPVLNVPCDPSGRVVARRVIRQCRGRPEREVARIANNTEPLWGDTDAGFADLPPGPSLNCWAANLPVVGSPLWQPGFAVRYAIVYEFADGTTARSRWVDENDGYLSSDGYARPVLNVPCDPSGRVVARRVIRQCRGRPERELARIADNTEPLWGDTDLGFADMPSTAMSGLYAAQRERLEAFFVQPNGALGFAHGVAAGLDLQSFRGAGRITGGVAALFARQRDHAEVFAVGEGGRLHYFFVSPNWMCDSTTFLPAAPITGPIAAVFGEARNHAEVFVVGGDGLLQRFHIDGAWRHEREPFRVAGPIKGLAVAYSRARDHAEVYAVDGSGTLHFFHGEGGAWCHSLVPGVKVDGAISAVYSPRRGHTEAFFRGDDGRLHFVYAEGGQWKHERAAFAGMGAVTGALAALFAAQRQESEVFLRGEDGRLRYVYCHEGVWMFDANTFAPAGAVTGGVAAVFNPRHNHAEVMFQGEGGNIHHFSIPGPQGWVHWVRTV